jgi:hypothetical protein
MRALALALALAGCQPAPPAKAPEPAAKVRLDVVQTTHNIERGELVVMEVPITGSKRITEHQTCFLWRDSEFKTASLQCPNDRASYTVDPP